MSTGEQKEHNINDDLSRIREGIMSLVEMERELRALLAKTYTRGWFDGVANINRQKEVKSVSKKKPKGGKRGGKGC